MRVVSCARRNEAAGGLVGRECFFQVLYCVNDSGGWWATARVVVVRYALAELNEKK